MRFISMLVFALVWCACSFEPDLEGQGYLRCEVQAECAGICTCGRVGYCLPPDGVLPWDCEPGTPSVYEPGRLLRVDWTDSDSTVQLFVDASGDDAFDPTGLDFGAALDLALHDDEALDLREAFGVAGLADRPVRIRFSQDLFPADGSGPEIALTDSLELDGREVLLDGRDTGEVITYAGDPNEPPLNLITVSGEVLALAGLHIAGHYQRALRVHNAEGVYLTGLTLDGNRIGAWIQRSHGVFLGDGAEYLGAGETLPNSFGYNNTGLVILQSSRVRVTGTEVIHGWEEGVRFGPDCQDVSIGPAVGEDSRDWPRVLIASNHTGINVFGFDGQAGVRGALLVANYVDVAIQTSQGVLAFVNVTVADSEEAVIEHHDHPGGLLLVLRNLIVHSQNQELFHLHCYGMGDSLEVDADRLMFSSGVNVECAHHGDGFGQAATIWESMDPGLVGPDSGDFSLGGDSPAIDAGVALDFEGVPLDFNGSGEGLYCGRGPDLGAFERCP